MDLFEAYRSAAFEGSYRDPKQVERLRKLLLSVVEDPRVVVYKANPWGKRIWWMGFTWNIGHPLAIPVMVAYVLGYLAPLGIAVAVGAPGWVIVGLAVAMVAVVFAVSARLAR